MLLGSIWESALSSIRTILWGNGQKNSTISARKKFIMLANAFCHLVALVFLVRNSAVKEEWKDLESNLEIRFFIKLLL